MHISKRETLGAQLAARFHISNAARMKTPAVIAIHNRLAVPQGSIARGATRRDVVGG
jgi:hypothetical protein